MSFLLHHTQLGNLAAKQACFVLHGVLGSGSNFRSLTKALAESRPGFRFVLVDLRLHGLSLAAPPPHTLEACAVDLERLVAHLGVSPSVVIGHSFGGKVLLSYAQRCPADLRQVWVLDSYPGAQPAAADHEVMRVIATLRAAARVTESREAFVNDLLERGLSLGIARWLSQNLIREGGQYRFRLDLAAVSQLVSDYFEQDLWSVLENPPANQEFHLVIAERSERLDRAAEARLSELAAEPQVFRHTLPNAGHWLHVDNPEGLLALFRQHLPPA